MDDVFGASEGLAAADQERQDTIMRRLGLLDDHLDEKKVDEENGSVKEKASEDEKVAA
jgi:hypothetical protein